MRFFRIVRGEQFLIDGDSFASKEIRSAHVPDHHMACRSNHDGILGRIEDSRKSSSVEIKEDWSHFTRYRLGAACGWEARKLGGRAAGGLKGTQAACAH